MNYNITELFDKIIISEENFDRIKDYSRSKNSRVPDYINLDSKLFNALEEFNTANLSNLDDPWIGGPKILEPNTQRKFKKIEDDIFLNDTTISPIYTDFIFKYHIFNDSSVKDKSINTLKKCLSSILKVYEIIEQENRYFDSNYNIIFTNLTVGISNKIEKRIEEVYSLDPVSIFTGPQREVYDILNKHGLL